MGEAAEAEAETGALIALRFDTDSALDWGSTAAEANDSEAAERLRREREEEATAFAAAAAAAVTDAEAEADGAVEGEAGTEASRPPSLLLFASIAVCF